MHRSSAISAQPLNKNNWDSFSRAKTGYSLKLPTCLQLAWKPGRRVNVFPLLLYALIASWLYHLFNTEHTGRKVFCIPQRFTPLCKQTPYLGAGIGYQYLKSRLQKREVWSDDERTALRHAVCKSHIRNNWLPTRWLARCSLRNAGTCLGSSWHTHPTQSRCKATSVLANLRHLLIAKLHTNHQSRREGLFLGR